jgi:hypothetical protein
MATCVQGSFSGRALNVGIPSSTPSVKTGISLYMLHALPRCNNLTGTGVMSGSVPFKTATNASTSISPAR